MVLSATPCGRPAKSPFSQTRHGRVSGLARLTVVLFMLCVSACGPEPAREADAGPGAADGQLRDRDVDLLQDVDTLMSTCGSAHRDVRWCVDRACRLRARELALFDRAREHVFTDLGESNYWHRGRLKFPSDLEQLLRRLETQSPRRWPICAASSPDSGAPRVE